MEGPPEDDCCPVCHGPFTLPCRTSCSHWFCADCILRVWLHGDALKSCKCPICCRYFSSLTLLEASLNQIHDPEATKVIKNVRRYNRLHVGGLKGLGERILNLPFFIWATLHDMMDPYKSSSYLFKARIFAIVLSIIYMLIPVKLAPIDGVRMLDLLDDSAIAFVTVMHLVGLYRTRRLFRGGSA